jgi:hypothetical protein
MNNISKAEEFLQHQIAKKWGGNSGIVNLSKVLEQLCFLECSILLVGTGWTHDQYYDWPTILEDVWNAKCSYLEVDEGYINKWKNEKYPLYQGSVIDIKKLISKPFDIIIWGHGPEHIKHQEMLSTFDSMYEKSNKGIVCFCPWGSYYDYQDVMNNNPFEKHLQKNMDENTFGPEFSNYSRMYGGIKDSGNGLIVIFRTK